MFGDPFPTCENCGVPIRDHDKHQRFHDLIGALYQRAYGLSDEEYERNTGMSAAERDARIVAAAEVLRPGSTAGSAGSEETEA